MVAVGAVGAVGREAVAAPKTASETCEKKEVAEKKTEIKAILSDYDGTIAGWPLSVGTATLNELILPPSFLEAYRKLKKNFEIDTYIVTGRPLAGFVNSRNALGAHEVSPYPGVYSDGRVIYDPQGNLVKCEGFGWSHIRYVLDMLDKYEIEKGISIGLLGLGARNAYIFEERWGEKIPKSGKSGKSGKFGKSGSVLPKMGMEIMENLFPELCEVVSDCEEIGVLYNDSLVTYVFVLPDNDDFGNQIHQDLSILLSEICPHEGQKEASPQSSGSPPQSPPELTRPTPMMINCGKVVSLYAQRHKAIYMARAGFRKGPAAVELCEHLKLPIDQVVTIGDGENDRELLKLFPHSFAIADGDPIAISNARYLANPPHLDGWATSILAFVQGNIQGNSPGPNVVTTTDATDADSPTPPTAPPTAPKPAI